MRADGLGDDENGGVGLKSKKTERRDWQKTEGLNKNGGIERETEGSGVIQYQV